MLEILAEAAVRSSCLAVVLAVALRTVRSSNPHTERAVWCAVLGVALLMPALMLLSRTSVAAPVSVSMPQLSVMRLSADGESRWQLMLLCVYWIVCLALLTRQGVALARAFAMKRRATPVHADGTGQLDVRVSDELETPVTVGSTILLPRHFTEWTGQQRTAVMAHERTHVLHHDFALLALAHLHRALFWFNPLAWWLPRRLAVLCEHLSDDAAISAMDNRRAYTLLLLAFASHRTLPPGAVAMARHSNVTTRVQRIVSQTVVTKRPGLLARAAHMSGVLAVTLLIAACDGRSGSNIDLAKMPPLPTGADHSGIEQPEGIERAPRSKPANPLSAPAYPATARRQQQQGTVVMQLHVLPNGRVDGVRIKASSGFASLDVAAAQEAWKWSLEPAIAAGQKVAAWGDFAVTFKLAD
jgi:TonB family protein